jgi:hypothetical protein
MNTAMPSSKAAAGWRRQRHRPTPSYVTHPGLDFKPQAPDDSAQPTRDRQ